MKTNYFKFIVLGLCVMLSPIVLAQKSPWKAPVESKTLKNPFKGNAKSTAEGKKIYDQMCVICHGNTGKGNGLAGLTLDQKPANFLAFKVQRETDGEIYWKLTNGRAPMASYEELLTEDQRWKLVNYIRELDK